MPKWELSSFKTWPICSWKEETQWSCVKFILSSRRKGLASACLWIYEEKCFLTRCDYRSWTFPKLTLILLTTSLQELQNYLFKHNQRGWHRQSTKYMYKDTIHVCTKTSLNISLASFWGFLHPSGLLQNTVMLNTFLVLHWLLQTSSQWWTWSQIK